MLQCRNAFAGQLRHKSGKEHLERERREERSNANQYKQLSEKLGRKMARKREVPFVRGKLEIWAAAVIYAIGQINFLFDKSFQPYASTDDLAKYFGVSKSTVGQKAQKIRELFKLEYFDEEFSTRKMRDSNPFANLVMVNGIPMDKSMLPPEIQEALRAPRVKRLEFVERVEEEAYDESAD